MELKTDDVVRVKVGCGMGGKAKQGVFVTINNT